jgi:hypothetical protein
MIRRILNWLAGLLGPTTTPEETAAKVWLEHKEAYDRGRACVLTEPNEAASKAMIGYSGQPIRPEECGVGESVKNSWLYVEESKPAAWVRLGLEMQAEMERTAEHPSEAWGKLFDVRQALWLGMTDPERKRAYELWWQSQGARK